jgi:hypothetical protein
MIVNNQQISVDLLVQAKLFVWQETTENIDYFRSNPLHLE